MKAPRCISLGACAMNAATVDWHALYCVDYKKGVVYSICGVRKENRPTASEVGSAISKK